MNPLTETLIDSKMLYSGRVVNLRLDTVQLPNGKTATREIVEHRGAVALVPLKGNSIVMVKQYRRAVGEVLLELPAGTLEAGEDPADCALRELEEETGYVAHKIRKLFSQYLAPGYSMETLHVFIAEDLTPSSQSLDEDENVEVVEVPISDIMPMIMNGMIKDAKTIAGALAALHTL